MKGSQSRTRGCSALNENKACSLFVSYDADALTVANDRDSVWFCFVAAIPNRDSKRDTEAESPLSNSVLPYAGPGILILENWSETDLTLKACRYPN
jgi:hypothetical protein